MGTRQGRSCRQRYSLLPASQQPPQTFTTAIGGPKWMPTHPHPIPCILPPDADAWTCWYHHKGPTWFPTALGMEGQGSNPQPREQVPVGTGLCNFPISPKTGPSAAAGPTRAAPLPSQSYLWVLPPALGPAVTALSRDGDRATALARQPSDGKAGGLHPQHHCRGREPLQAGEGERGLQTWGDIPTERGGSVCGGDGPQGGESLAVCVTPQLCQTTHLATPSPRSGQDPPPPVPTTPTSLHQALGSLPCFNFNLGGANEGPVRSGLIASR